MPIPTETRESQRINIIWKVTNDCNLKCTYCYADACESGSKVSSEQMKVGISKFTDHYGKDTDITVVLHGGEPMLLFYEFYSELFDEVDELTRQGYNIRIGMQSNGTLLGTNEGKTLGLLLQNGVVPGLSLDGNSELNELTRPLCSGKNSYEQVVEGIKELHTHGYGGGVLTVVSTHNIGQLVSIYDHMKELGVSGCNFNPMAPIGRARGNQDLGITAKQWNKAMIELFDYWYADEEKIPVEPFTDIIGGIMVGYRKACNASKSCQKSFIAVGVDGSVFPCSRMCGDQKFYLGNIFEDNIENILNHPTRTKMKSRYDSVPKECKEQGQDCKFVEICYGGCMHDAQSIEGDFMRRTGFCEKPLFNHIYQRVDADVRSVKHIVRE